MEDDNTKKEGLSERMDKELAEHLERVFEKNKDYKYTGGLSEENWEEEIKNIPLFSREEPTQEDIDKSTELQALQALKYQCEDPHEYAIAHKDDGNYHFQRKEYRKAIIAYTEAIKQKHQDNLLYAVLCTNRAAANFYLGNNRSALIDAMQALNYKPDHMKAVIRCATCCFDLEKYDDCIKWSDRGLKIDEKEKKLLDLKKKSLHQKKQQDRDKRKHEMRQVKNLTKQDTLLDAVKARNINIAFSSCNKNEAAERLLVNDGSPHSGKLYLDESKVLHWPVYFLYPEYSKSDFIEDFNENDIFDDHIAFMFGDGNMPEWDVERKYIPQDIEIYFEDQQREKLVHVAGRLTLRAILSDKRYTLHGGCPAFTILSRSTKYYKELNSIDDAEKFST